MPCNAQQLVQLSSSSHVDVTKRSVVACHLNSKSPGITAIFNHHNKDVMTPVECEACCEACLVAHWLMLQDKLACACMQDLWCQWKMRRMI